jgi:hypothetical protein
MPPAILHPTQALTQQNKKNLSSLESFASSNIKIDCTLRDSSNSEAKTTPSREFDG